MFNKSTYYVLPMLNIRRSIIQNYLIGVYIGSNKIKNMSDKNYVLVELKANKPSFFPIADRLELLPNYITKFKELDSYFYIFRILDEYIPDYQLYIKSKYSKLSSKIKDRIIVELDDRHKCYKHIMYPTQQYIDVIVNDLCPKPLTKCEEMIRSYERHRKKIEKVLKENEINELLNVETEYCNK